MSIRALLKRYHSDRDAAASSNVLFIAHLSLEVLKLASLFVSFADPSFIILRSVNDIGLVLHAAEVSVRTFELVGCTVYTRIAGSYSCVFWYNLPLLSTFPSLVFIVPSVVLSIWLYSRVRQTHLECKSEEERCECCFLRCLAR
ncbi:hypothetical protein AVEN_251921-1 [Araneus ventricosus]|uniref:Uncharacterized protein n=1 Tax=Araneus ventricosus TaxID=182803 RepID=A0A4Y2GXA0_ARAVE|nr:hypothetical protein AVEN_251921-1 [Araneus ventricosus]